MTGRNSRSHAGSPGAGFRIFRQVYDFATDGGTTAGSPISLRGQGVPSEWLICGGIVDIHTAFASGAATPPGAATVSVGINADTHWISGAGAATDANNLIPAEALTGNWDSAIPRSFSTGNDTHGRDGLAVQVAATAPGFSLATITVGVENLTAGAFSLYLFAFAADNGTV
jgi:hypothetical protein